MKKFVCLLLSLLLLFSLTACGDDTPADSSMPDESVSESSDPDSSVPEADESTPTGDETTTTQGEDDTSVQETTASIQAATTAIQAATTTQEKEEPVTTTSKKDKKTTVRKTIRTSKTTTTARVTTMQTTTVTTTTKTTDPAADIVTWENPTTNYANNKYADYIDYRTPLTNSYNKLTKDKELKVVYIGGSLTNGSGVSESLMDQKSWRGLTGQWLKETFPKADITNINAAVGATGSTLGVFRVEEDVIKQKPDLVFVEFAINDQYYYSGNNMKSSISLETLIREIRQGLPYSDIVVLITADRGCAQQYYGTPNSPHPVAKAHMKIAQAYGVSVVNIADAFMDEVAESTGNDQWASELKLWRRYITDDVHPNEDGYAMWFNYVKEYLENSLLHTDYTGFKTVARQVPSVQNYFLMDGNRQSYFGADIFKQVVKSDDTFTYVEEKYGLRSGYYTLDRGDSVTLKFTGTECAIWTKFEPVEFKISYTIDGKDTYTLKNKWADPYYLIMNLEPGEHTIKITYEKDSPLKQFSLVGFFSRDDSQKTTRS